MGCNGRTYDPKKLIQITRMCVSDSRSRVSLEETSSEFLEVDTWLKYDDALSPWLFNIVLEKAIRVAQIHVKLLAGNEPQIVLAYADDLDVIRNRFKVKVIFREWSAKRA